MKVAGILLAAGASVRFGGNKMMHPLPEGEARAGMPIAVASATNMLAALPDTVAVVRPRSQKLAHLLREAGAKVVTCRNANEGMGASLARAVAAADDADAWIVGLGDMPWIAPETILTMARMLTEGAVIVAPSFDGNRGHPVGFARRFHDELRASSGDEGARKLFRDHADLVTLLPVEDPGVLRDIDTPQDLAGGATQA